MMITKDVIKCRFYITNIVRFSLGKYSVFLFGKYPITATVPESGFDSTSKCVVVFTAVAVCRNGGLLFGKRAMFSL